jgi:hypothetical protein
MTPTPKLRFIERKDFTQDVGNPRTLRILQQWWEGEKWNETRTQILLGEWRDVPLEKEA